jgi:hypothetical protein
VQPGHSHKPLEIEAPAMVIVPEASRDLIQENSGYHYNTFCRWLAFGHQQEREFPFEHDP